MNNSDGIFGVLCDTLVPCLHALFGWLWSIYCLSERCILSIVPESSFNRGEAYTPTSILNNVGIFADRWPASWWAADIIWGHGLTPPSPSIPYVYVGAVQSSTRRALHGFTQPVPAQRPQSLSAAGGHAAHPSQLPIAAGHLDLNDCSPDQNTFIFVLVRTWSIDKIQWISWQQKSLLSGNRMPCYIRRILASCRENLLLRIPRNKKYYYLKKKFNRIFVKRAFVVSIC